MQRAENADFGDALECSWPPQLAENAAHDGGRIDILPGPTQCGLHLGLARPGMSTIFYCIQVHRGIAAAAGKRIEHGLRAVIDPVGQGAAYRLTGAAVRLCPEPRR